MAEGFFSVAQAAGKIGVDFDEIVRAIRSRRLYARSINGRYQIQENDLMEFVHELHAPTLKQKQ